MTTPGAIDARMRVQLGKTQTTTRCRFESYRSQWEMSSAAEGRELPRTCKPFCAIVWPEQPTPLVTQLAGGHTSTRLVKFESSPAAAVAPSSHGCSTVGSTPAAHTSYVMPFATSKYAPSAPVVRSVSVGGGGDVASTASATPACRSSRHEPPELPN